MSLESEVTEMVCEEIIKDILTSTSFIQKDGCYYMITGELDDSGDTYTAEELIYKAFSILDTINDKK